MLHSRKPTTAVKLTAILLTALASNIAISADNKTNPVRLEYDFKTKNSSLWRKTQTVDVGTGIRDRGNFTIRITHINPLKYKAKIELKGNTYFADKVPSALGAFKIDVGEAKKTDKPVAAPGGQAILDNDPVMMYLSEVDDLVESLTGLEKQLAAISEKATQIDQASKSAEDEDDMKAQTTTLLRQWSPTATTTNMLSEKASSALSEENQPASVGGLQAKAQDLAKKATTLIQSLQAQMDASNLTVPQYKALEAKKAKVMASQDVLKDASTRIKKLIEGKKSYLDTLNAVVVQANKALSGEFYHIDRGTFEMSGDEVQVTITIEESKDKGEKFDPIKVTIPTTGGFKIDYSAGLIATSLDDFTYKTAVNGGGTYDLARTTHDNGSVKPVAFVNFHTFGRTNPLAITFGTTVSGEPIYVLGLSHMTGVVQRVNFTFGIAYGKVVRMEEGLTFPIATADVPTRPVYMYRPFFGLSYNF